MAQRLDTRLSRLLLDDGTLSVEALEDAVQQQVIHGGALDTILLETGKLDEGRVAEGLARAWQTPAVIRDDVEAPAKDAVARLPRRMAAAMGICPFRVDDDGVHVMLGAPPDQDLIDEVASFLGTRLVAHVVPEVRLHQALHSAYGVALDERTAALLKALDQGTRMPVVDEVTAGSDEGGGGESVGLEKQAKKWALPDALSHLAEQGNREGIAKVVVAYARRFLPFAAFFGVRDGRALGWARSGHFEGAQFDHRPFDVPGDCVVAQVLESPSPLLAKPPISDGNSALFGWLGRRRPPTAVLIPIAVAGRTVAVLYGDSGVRKKETDALADLVAFGARVGPAFESLLRARHRAHADLFRRPADDDVPAPPPAPEVVPEVPAPPPEPEVVPDIPAPPPVVEVVEVVDVVETEAEAEADVPAPPLDADGTSPFARDYHAKAPAAPTIEEIEAKGPGPGTSLVPPQDDYEEPVFGGDDDGEEETIVYDEPVPLPGPASPRPLPSPIDAAAYESDDGEEDVRYHDVVEYVGEAPADDDDGGNGALPDDEHHVLPATLLVGPDELLPDDDGEGAGEDDDPGDVVEGMPLVFGEAIEPPRPATTSWTTPTSSARDGGTAAGASPPDEPVLAAPDEESWEDVVLDAANARQLTKNATAPVPQSPRLEAAPKPRETIPPAQLVAQLESMHARVVQDAKESLMALGEEAVPALKDRFPGRLLVDPFAEKHPPDTAADLGPLIETVVTIGPAALDAAIPHLDSRYPAHRFAATFVFDAIPDERAIELLRPRLHDSEPRIRRLAASALSHWVAHKGFDGVLVHLRQRLSSAAPETRQRAVWFLGYFRDVGSVPQLMALLDDHPEVAKAARTALKQITLQDLGLVSKAWQKWWKRARRVSRIDWLIEGLRSRDRDLRYIASIELSRLSGDSFGYRCDDPKGARDKAIKGFESWWSVEQSKLRDRVNA